MIGCETCLYMATHENCGTPGKDDYCLRGGTKTDNPDGGRTYDFPYYNWVGWNDPEEPFERLQTLQLSGERNIVIGWQGEAEVNAKDSYEDTLANLCYVAEQCGYLVGGNRKKETITCCLPHGKYELRYCKGQFVSIWKNERQVWPDDAQ